MPTLKRSLSEKFEDVADWCSRFNIELNCFIIVGLPGTTPEGTIRAFEKIARANARVRPTLYTPYMQMREDMTERELSAFNRHIFVDPEAVLRAGRDPYEFIKIVFSDDEYVTPATKRIPSHKQLDALRQD
jgi:hypothetical protein